MHQDIPQEAGTGLVLVTGITGFLAGHIAVALIRRGYHVRGTLRSPARAEALEQALRAQPGCADAQLSMVTADLMDDGGWDEAARGCDFVIHTASPAPARAPRDRDALVGPARDGTVRVLRAARAAGVNRVVMTSSEAAVKFGHAQAPFTEADWTDPDGPRTTAYYKSKTLAERAAWQFAREHGLELVVLNPGFLVGPVLQARCGGSMELIRRLLAGKLPGLPDLGLAVSDVRDVAAAHAQALTTSEAAGERFLVAGPWLKVERIAALLREACPQRARRIPTRRIPSWLVRLAAHFDAELRSVSGELGYDSRVSHAKASRVLGWQPREAAQSIGDAAASLLRFALV